MDTANYDTVENEQVDERHLTCGTPNRKHCMCTKLIEKCLFVCALFSQPLLQGCPDVILGILP